ncbi:MAG: VOC family protein [Planctomycetes bacterium]|nr:VOC family protein [Planctomycetota bacterium]
MSSPATQPPRASPIKSIKFASIPVSDQDRALAFYTQKLGFVVATDQPMPGPEGGGQRWIELRIPGAETRLVLFTPDAHKDRIGTWQHVTFHSDDVDAAYRIYRERGVEFLGQPEEQPWGTFVLFKDPDGNVMVLSSSKG